MLKGKFRREVRMDDSLRGGMGMDKERRQALGIFLAVTALACNYSPLVRQAIRIPSAQADVAASAKAYEGRMLIPGGQAVGVALRTQGVLVVAKGGRIEGTERIESKSPLRVGDVIEQVQGRQVRSAAELSERIGAWPQEQVELGVLRRGRRMTLEVSLPTGTDGRRRLGVWVRDSTAGVGTLSYIDPVSGAYGALGHAIVDGDTGDLLPVADGAILSASVVGVIKGQSGQAGELKGSFLKENEQIGTLALNSEYGIYGCLEETPADALYPRGLPVGTREMAHPGRASILSTVDGEGVKEYSVEILRCFDQSKPSQKGMVLRVTDERLLEKTGGIVQGMSGSPILQDGRIIGAVTHVYLSDAAQGYGMYIEWMLERSDALSALDQAA